MHPEPTAPSEAGPGTEPTADEIAAFVRAHWSALPAADRAYLAHLRRTGGEPAHSLALGDRSAAGMLRIATYGMIDAQNWEAASRAAVRLHRIETETGVPPIRLGPIEGFHPPRAPEPQAPQPQTSPPEATPTKLTGRALCLKRKAERIEARRIEAERIEAERIEAKRIEAKRIEARSGAGDPVPSTPGPNSTLHLRTMQQK